MGRYDSSLTRVQPVFKALYERDASGKTWLRQLLGLCWLGLGSEPAPIPKTLDRLVAPPQFELPVDPSRSYLRWLIEHPENLSSPREAVWRTWGERTQKRRRALLDGDTVVQAEALAKLEKQALPDRAWWRFEGVTRVDCALLTQSTAIFVEGKRTERGPSKKVAWYPVRNQVLRVLDCAAAFARKTERPYFFVVLVVEKGLVESDPDRQAAVEAVTSPRTVQESLPHLTDEERAELLAHYLGTTTWQDIVETFELGSGVLIDRVDC